MVDLNGKTIVVTGGSGFIGSNFIEYIVKNYSNMTIYNIDKMGVGSRVLFTYGPTPSIIHARESLYLDRNNTYNFKLMDLSLVKDLDIGVRIDYVFHFAAESHVDRSISGPIKFIENNVMGITNLLEWVRNKQFQAKVVNISTDEVYGHLGYDDEPFTENSPLHPRSPYSASKASADLIANSYFETYGLNIITTRCCNNYGPNQHSEKFIPTILRCLRNGEKIPVYGSGWNVREWIYVDDHNKSILEIIDNCESGKVYNIGSGVEKDNIQLITCILDQIYQDGDHYLDYIKFVDDRKGHDFRYALQSLNYKRTFTPLSLYEGLNRTINAFSCGK